MERNSQFKNQSASISNFSTTSRLSTFALFTKIEETLAKEVIYNKRIDSHRSNNQLVLVNQLTLSSSLFSISSFSQFRQNIMSKVDFTNAQMITLRNLITKAMRSLRQRTNNENNDVEDNFNNFDEILNVDDVNEARNYSRY